MPVCKKIRGQKRQVCIGDKDQFITIQSRNIKTPGSVDPANNLYFTEDFPSAADKNVWAMVETISGEEFFDNTNQNEISVTHRLYVDFDEEITAQNWVKLENGDRVKVLSVEDLDNRHIDMLLRCTNRGPSSNSNNDV